LYLYIVMYNIFMKAEKAILQYLSDSRDKKITRYKGFRTGFLGLPDFAYYKYQTLANRCSELKNKGYIKQVNGDYFITFKGEEFLNKKEHIIFKKFKPNKTENDPKDLLLLYDISEQKRSERNWFRRELRHLHFIMIQRSVWVGPSPLPNEFTQYLKNLNLKNEIKTIKLENGYKVK